MVHVLDYLKPYFEINSMAAWLIGFLFLSIVWKFQPSSRRTLWLFIVLGLMLRIFWVNFSSHEPHFTWTPTSLIENDWINMNAVELTEGKWFQGPDGMPSGRRPIGYPIVLGICYKIFGIHAEVAWVLHLVLFVFTAFFIYRIAKGIFSEQVGILSAAMFSLYPISIYSVKLITDEHLFLFLWYGGIAFLVDELNLGLRKRSWLFYGIVFGFAAMTRTYAIFMPVVVGLAYLIKKVPVKKSLLTALLIFAVMQLVNLPWLIRNYKIWKVPVVYAVAGHSVYLYTNPMATPEIGHLPVQGEPGYSEEFHQIYPASSNEGLIQRQANREIKKWFFRDPIAFGELAISKLLFFMHWGKKKGVWPLWYQFTEGNYDPSHALGKKEKKFLEKSSFIFYYIIFHLSLAGIFLAGLKCRRPNFSLAGAIVLISSLIFWCGLHLIIMPDPKYRFPIEPIMIIFTAFFCIWINSLDLVSRLTKKSKA